MEDINVEELQFQIKRVKSVSFYLNENYFIADPTKVIKIDLNHSIGTNEEKNQINFTLTINLRYENSAPNEKLAGIAVQNIYEVPALKSFIREQGLLIPPPLLISIVSISLSHARALFSKELGGTVYQEVVLPILDPVKLTNHFFPHLLKAEEVEEKIKGLVKINQPKEDAK